MAEEKDPYAGLSEEQQKKNEEAMKRMESAVPTPSQEEVDKAVTHQHGDDPDVGKKQKRAAPAEEKAEEAEKPKGNYKTRTVDPERK